MPRAPTSSAPLRPRRRQGRPGRPENPSTAAERHARLVEAAISVISREGLGAASTRAVAAAAGVNQAMVHYSFPGKHELLLAVLEKIHADLRALLSAAVAGADSLPQAIARLARRMWDYVLQAPELQKVQYELTLYALSTPASARMARLQYEGYVDALAAVLAQVPSAPNAKSLRMLAGTCVATMDGLILQHLAVGDAAASEARLRLSIAALQTLCRKAP